MIPESKTIVGANYARVFESSKWYSELMHLPPLNIPYDCGIHVLPPYLGAVVRFAIAHHQYYERIYVELVCYGSDLTEGPYWRIAGNGGRTIKMDDIMGLEMAIKLEMMKKTSPYSPQEKKKIAEKPTKSWFKGIFK